jgi:transcriptional regulator GlxA family with amidase domain
MAKSTSDDPAVIPRLSELILGHTVVDGRRGYQVTICTAEPGLVETTGGMRVKVDHGLRVAAAADTVIVTGTGARDDVDTRVLNALRRATDRGKRIA